jgi:SlyX protein
MTDPETDQTSSQLDERLIRIEMSLAHLQQDIDAINESLLNHLQRIQAFEGRFSRIEAAVDRLSEPAEQRDPGNEQPPHY